VAFRTVGCRLNQCETAQMQEALLAAGFHLVEWEQSATVRVVNTCTVTARSDRTCRREIHLAKRLDPDCLLAVTGCFAQVAPESVAAIPGVDLVIGNPDKQSLAEYLAASLRERPGTPTVAVSAHPQRTGFETEFITHFRGHTRAFLKIQTGCDSRCAYCVVPLARGPARSMPKAAVLEQVRLLAARGYREVVLTGIDLGSWGRGSGEGSLADLLSLLLENGETRGGDLAAGSPGGKRLADACSGARPADASGGARPDRFRLSSIEPLEVDEPLIEVVERGGERIARHFHLPLQSGADSVLARMGRPYRAADYLQIAERLSQRLPDVALGADVIVGFPGETAEEFEQTLALVEASPLNYLHVFAYSDRPGTAAAAMQPKIRTEVIQERSEHLRDLGVRKKMAFRGRLVESDQRVLVLKDRPADGRLVGLTGNYMEVLLDGDVGLLNRFARVRLHELLPDGRWEGALLEGET
jgi:threonylcarbamoyladenosine tRNA methylthiotransferase MtaB